MKLKIHELEPYERIATVIRLDLQFKMVQKDVHYTIFEQDRYISRKNRAQSSVVRDIS